MKQDNINDILVSIFGKDQNIYNPFEDHKIIKMPTISYDEYMIRKLKVAKFCLMHEEWFNAFYLSNKELIDEIYHQVNEKHNYTKRKIGILPIK